jgi:serine/threonine protein kinase
MPYRQKRRLVLDVAEGLFALHSCSITHSDMKMENVLMFPSGSSEYPFIAKLSDYGFSIDNPSTADSLDHLLGFTPLWTAPEASGKIPVSRMHLTDIYSLGFIIWSVVIDGKSPFLELRHLPEEPQSRFEAFTFLKDTDELLPAAFDQIRCSDVDPDINLVEVSDLLSRTLVYDPEKRDLLEVIGMLRPSCQREGETELLNGTTYGPLKPFDQQKVVLSDF